MSGAVGRPPAPSSAPTGVGGSSGDSTTDGLDAPLINVVVPGSLASILLDDASDVSLFDDSFAEDITTKPMHMDELLNDNPQVKEALEQGVDLREFSKKIEAELHQVEEAAVQDYMKEADQFASLHTQIRSCDGILERMELLLSGFQSELGKISSEIRHLQDESTTMSVKLANRQAVSSRVTHFVQSAMVPEYLMNEICEGEVNDLYLEYIMELNKKITFSGQQEFKDTLAITEMKPRLVKLRYKVIDKSRSFLLMKTHALKKPRTNLQIQQNVMSRYKFLNRFLFDHAPTIFQEVRQDYTETLSKIYSTYFKTYIASMLKLYVPTATKLDLLGTLPGRLKSWTDHFSKSKMNVFALGVRDEILDDIEADAIVPHERKQSLTMPVLIRSLHHYLLDSVTSEFLFDMDFFGLSQHLSMFAPIFGDTVSLCLTLLTNHLRESYDSVGIMIMLRINALNQQIMVRRAVPVLAEHFELTNDVLWHRFEQVISLNVESLNAFEIAPKSVEATRPHFVIRRYAELSTSLLSLTVTFKHPQLLKNMNALREAVLGLLARLSQNVSNKTDVAHWARVFMIINLDMMLMIMRDRDTVSTETVLFTDQLEADIDAFVRGKVQTHFGSLSNFVSSASRGGVDQDLATALVKSFHATWKSSMEKMCKEVMFSGVFSNLTLAAAITSKVLLQVTALNNQLWQIVHESMGENALSRFYVADFQLADEVKRHGIE